MTDTTSSPIPWGRSASMRAGSVPRLYVRYRRLPGLWCGPRLHPVQEPCHVPPPLAREFHQGAERVPVRASGRLSVNYTGVLLWACLSGQGIAQTLELYAQSYINDGHLVSLLEDWTEERFPLHAYVSPGGTDRPRSRHSWLSSARRLRHRRSLPRRLMPSHHHRLLLTDPCAPQERVLLNDGRTGRRSFVHAACSDWRAHRAPATLPSGQVPGSETCTTDFGIG